MPGVRIPVWLCSSWLRRCGADFSVKEKDEASPFARRKGTVECLHSPLPGVEGFFISAPRLVDLARQKFLKIIDNQPLLGCTGGALTSDEFKPGPIYLQGDHGAVAYRNLRITPAVPAK